MYEVDNDILNPYDQKDFWDSLQMDMINANQKLTKQDYAIFIERSFMFSIFFRGCSPLEVACFRTMFDIKEYAYLILFELIDTNKTNSNSSSIDEEKLYSTVRDTLKDRNCAVGPIITSRFSVLISHDSMLKDHEYKEESMAICHELIHVLVKEFNIEVKAGVGSMQNIQNIYTSCLDALACMYYNNDTWITNYIDYKKITSTSQFDYIETGKRLNEAVRLRKTEAYDYFGIIMEYIRPLPDEAKRNKILEILVLANHAMQIDSGTDVKNINYTSYLKQFMELTGNELIEFAFQSFIYITSYAKQQTTIDYTNHVVKATRQYLEKHYTDDISLEDMASQVNISPQYFSKLIKKTTGFNFIDWLSMLRVRKAKELLTDSSLTVKEVCFMVGYKDPNYFSRIFKKRIGITPSEYVKTSSYLNNKS